MSQCRRATWRNLAYDTRGSEIAEAAFVLPILFVVLIAIFWFGQAFRVYGTITHAAREGARAAVAPACATCTTVNSPTQNAINAVSAALAAEKLPVSGVQLPIPVPTLLACGSAAAVPCDTSVPGNNVCVQPNVQLPLVTPGAAGTCGTAVSFGYKYSFHFTLPCWPQPCTSLDLQNLTLPARAQMRVETQ
jgi:Flp pilus assembly protein TadG